MLSTLLSSVKGTTFISVLYRSELKLQSPKNNPLTAGVKIYKIAGMTGICAGSVSDAVNIYKTKIEKQIGEEFILSASNYVRTQIYSILENKAGTEKYLEIFPTNGKCIGYYLEKDGTTKRLESVSELQPYMTPGEFRKIIDKPVTTYNAKNDVEHNVQVRCIKLSNIISVKIKGHTLRGQDII